MPNSFIICYWALLLFVMFYRLFSGVCLANVVVEGDGH